MRVIIAGSREIEDYKIVEKAIEESGFNITTIVCGLARGPDMHGYQYAMGNNIPVKEFAANWTKFNKAAGPIRNNLMAKYADALILVWDGKSPGSKNMLSNAKKYGLKIYEKIIDIKPPLKKIKYKGILKVETDND